VTTDNVSPEVLDAPRPPAEPAAPPATHIRADLIPDYALERIEHLLSQEQKDALETARIAGREEKRAAQQKAKAESDASTARAKAVTDEIVQRDANTQEEQRPEPGGPPVELTVTPMLDASQTKIAEGYTADMSIIAGEMGIPQEEAQTLLDFVIDGAVQTLEGLDTSNQEECVSHLKSLYGETSAAAIIQGARAGFAKLPEGIQAWLDQTTSDGQVLGNHPAVLSMLALWNGGYSKLTPERAAAELAQHRASKLYASGDRLTLDKVRLLGQIATRGQSGELPMPAKAAPVAKSQIQTRIDAIRRDPHYMGDTKLRAALVAEMGDLYRQLHPEA
jgi:hypothetical protein